jgi:pimeloyl-ACP methyl ester carboxylesterase
MATIRDYTLAQFADTAFQDTPAALPGGFSPLTAGALGVVVDAPGESFTNGVYRQDNAAALVGTGILGGQATIVLAFRGADDRVDSNNVLRDPATDYGKFAELIAAVDKLAASGAYQQVAIAGHSLGGSLAQVFMANHPDGTTPVHYVADTFGSPGALVPDANDARITNFVVVDDPAVFLGENREAVGNTIEGNIVLERGAAELAGTVFPGLTVDDALAAIPSFTANYENAGATVNLPGKAGGTGPVSSVTGLLQADPAQHAITLYIREIGDIAFRLPGSGNEQLFDAGFYLRHNPDVQAAGVNALQHFETFGWREGRDASAAFDTGYYLQHNPDVAAAGVNPLQHFETYGWREGRAPDAFFSPGAYLAANPDVAATGVNPLIHYLLYGWSEGRDPGPDFDTSAYLAANPDVAAAGVNPLLHYLEFGINEGRMIA